MQRWVLHILTGSLAMIGMACGSSSDEPTPPVTPDQSNLPVSADHSPAIEDGFASEPDNQNDSGTVDDQVPNPGQPSWKELERLDVEKDSIIVFKGTDPAIAASNLFLDPSLWEDETCTIYIVAEFKNEDDQQVYAVKTSFRHNNDRPPVMLITFSERDALLVVGSSESQQDLISFDLHRPDDLSSVYRVRVKWFHINHYDHFTCNEISIRN